MFTQLLEKIACNAPNTDFAGIFPKKEFEWLAEEGLLKIVLPEQYLDYNKPTLKCLLQLLKNIGSSNLSVGRIYEGHLNALQLIHLFATPQQKCNWYNLIKNENKLFGVWNTEADEGVEIHEIPGGYKLNGCKTYCSGAHWIARPIITGKIISTKRNGWQMCVIPVEKVLPIKEDSSFWDPTGMKASASFKMDFTGIEIGEDDLLGEVNCYYKEPYFNGGAIRFAAVQLGGAIAIMEHTHLILKKFKRTETDFQRARMTEMAILAESGNNWLNNAAAKTEEWNKQPESITKITNYAGMVRLAIENICTRIIYLSAVSVGPRGLMKPLVLERLHRDLNFYLRQPGPDAVTIDIGKFLFNKEKIENVWS